MILDIIKAVLLLGVWFSKYAHDKQLLDSGEHKAIARANEEALNNINAAIIARRANSMPELDDPDNRD